MQRPRRTSELHDDNGGIHRHSRAQSKSSIAPSPSGGGTAVKFVNRQSRIAVLSRPSSQERAGCSSNAFLSVPQTVQRRVTPQKTPLSNKTNANRVLFTAEKHRSGGGNLAASGPLHNDKKWIQEHSHRITEYLLNYPTIGGLSSDFLNRGLRQMSIKQFVAIVNFFLGFIWGKRFVVGSNHVEDIIQILQKLHYPYAVNKSWLKTPNTQHSFGNVIVLLDFLMDFVPPFSVDDVEPLSPDYFELQEPQEMNASRATTEDVFSIPDLEFQYELLRNSEEGFMLWDRQVNDEFNNLQQTTCDFLIQRTCNFPNAKAIGCEIEKLKTALKALEDETPIENLKMLKSKQDKIKQLRDLRSEISQNGELYRENNRDLKRLKKRISKLSIEMDELDKQINHMQETIGKQTCNVGQRDQLVAEKNQMEQMLKIEGDSVRNLEDRNYQKQVLYSRVLHSFTEQVGLFNELMREIAFSDIPECRKISLEDLQLPLRPDNARLQKLIPVLRNIHDLLMKSINENKSKIIAIQDRAKSITNEVDSKLETQLNSLRFSNTTTASHLENLRQLAHMEHAELNAKLHELQDQLSPASKIIEQLQQQNAKKRTEIDLMKEQNERTMQQAEETHEKCVAERRVFLEAYDKLLEASLGSGVLEELKQQVEDQEKLLEEFKQQL